MTQLKFINHLIDEYALQVSYDPYHDEGEVIFILTLIKEEDLDAARMIMKEAYAAGVCVSNRVMFAVPGESIGDYVIPPGHIGVVTMCSITVDAILLRQGIPLNPIGGGLVEIRNNIPKRFTTIIKYDSTTIDPTQVMIDQGTTHITDVIMTGTGSILANIRECHMEAETLLFDMLEDLNKAGITGVLEVGSPNSPLLGVPITTNYLGLAMIGGTNPIAAFIESGRWADTKAMKGLIDIANFDKIENI